MIQNMNQENPLLIRRTDAEKRSVLIVSSIINYLNCSSSFSCCILLEVFKAVNDSKHF
jgi:hypothetical protein